MIKGQEKGVGHRSSNDKQWQDVKEIVKKRDKNMCVLCKSMSSKEYGEFMKSNPTFLGKIEFAHIISVGNHVEKTYDPNNVVCLCHTHHQRLDSMLNPITGKPMKKSEHDNWWERIKKIAKISDNSN